MKELNKAKKPAMVDGSEADVTWRITVERFDAPKKSHVARQVILTERFLHQGTPSVQRIFGMVGKSMYKEIVAEVNHQAREKKDED